MTDRATDRQNASQVNDSNRKNEKLQKHLAALGYGSRREIERWIEQGRVSIDGRQARLGDRVSATQQIVVDGKPVRRPTPHKTRVLVYNKPEGEICSRSDPKGRPTVFDGLPRIRGARWISVGRLDFNTRGLLLFTNDGVLANRLMHPSHEFEREYHCRVFGRVSEATIQHLLAGYRLDGKPARFYKVIAGRGEGRNRWYTVIVKEGRYREVRRLWEKAGCTVSRLIRIRYGPVRLPKRLRPGTCEELPPAMIDRLLGNQEKKMRGK